MRDAGREVVFRGLPGWPLNGTLRRLPVLTGAPIQIERVRGLRDRRGEVHAGSFLRERRVAFDCTHREFPRILVHELFHFVWLRLGNNKRRSFERIVVAELRAGIQGELGWSAEWRKDGLSTKDRSTRSRKWREYCCESFCDTAAWVYSGVKRHPEFTLAKRARQTRETWFADEFSGRDLPV